MITVTFDNRKLISVVRSIIKRIIIKRAYMGYCAWMKINTDDSQPLPLNKFKQFEFWKITLSFRIYLHVFHGIKFENARLSFKSMVMFKKVKI